MSRGIGEFGVIQDIIPDWAAIFIALLTQLGDVWFLALLVGAAYWFYATKRDDAAVLVGFTIAGLALISVLKHIFALPRPGSPLVEVETLPWTIQPLYEVTAAASGYGFPSGHALMTTIVYLSFAHRLPISSRRRRFAAAAALITAVCLSRVGLGVHYLIDVVVGVGVGILFLIGAEWLLSQSSMNEGTLALGLAIVVSSINLTVGGADFDGVLLLGAALGAICGWQLLLLGQQLDTLNLRSGLTRPQTARGILAGIALVPLVTALVAFNLFSLPFLGGVLGISLAVVMAIPALPYSKLFQRRRARSS
jgi:membrane-associated phospholipid phosphatase